MRSERLVRVCVLKADNAIPPVVSAYGGDYEDMFRDLLTTAGKEDGVTVEVETFDPRTETYPPDRDDFDGFLITGSSHDAFASDMWIERLCAYVRQLNREQRKVVGVCFGHQIIARAFGGVVERNAAGWEVSRTSFRVIGDLGKRAFSARQEVYLMQMHQDHVVKMPDCLHCIGSSDTVPCQALSGHNVFAVQGHPEFTPEVVKVLLERRKGVIPEEMRLQGLEDASKPTDHLLVARQFVRFFMDLIESS